MFGTQGSFFDRHGPLGKLKRLRLFDFSAQTECLDENVEYVSDPDGIGAVLGFEPADEIEPVEIS